MIEKPRRYATTLEYQALRRDGRSKMKLVRMVLLALAMLVGKTGLADCPVVEIEVANAMSRAEILASYCKPLHEPDSVVAQYLERQKAGTAPGKHNPLTKD